MKRVILAVFTVVAALLFCGCNCIQETTAKPVSSASKKLKVGLYVDDGASGNGVLHLASLITHSPQTELVLLVAEDIRAGKLKNVDVLVMPGGSSSKQCNTIGKEHLNTKKLLHSLLACSSFCVLQSLSAESGSAVLGCELGTVITDVFVDVGNKDFRTVVEP